MKENLTTTKRGERLRRFAEIAFKNISEFATAMEWSKPAPAYTYFNEKTEPGAPILQKLHELGCNINWYLFDLGEMFAENEAGQKLREDYFKKVKVAGTNTPETEKEKDHREIEHERS